MPMKYRPQNEWLKPYFIIRLILHLCRTDNLISKISAKIAECFEVYSSIRFSIINFSSSTKLASASFS